MGKTATNIAIALGIITVAFAGYFVYTQSAEPALNFSENDQTLRNMRNNSQKFIERRKILDEVKLNFDLFEDDRFRSLRAFTTDIEERPIGRPNPFAEPNPAAQPSS